MEIEKKLKALSLTLPPAPQPMATYISAVRSGNLLFLAGHVPRLPDGTILHQGKLGREVTIDQGYESAHQTILNPLATIKSYIGDLCAPRDAA